MELFSIIKLEELLEKQLDVGTRKALELGYLLSTMAEERPRAPLRIPPVARKLPARAEN